MIMLRSHGITKDKARLINKLEGEWYYEMQELGFNYRITDFQCALGTSQLKRIEKFISKRKKIKDLYNAKLAGIKNLTLPAERNYVESSWHLYCLRVKNSQERKLIFNRLRSSGIGAQIHYIPIFMQPYYKKVFPMTTLTGIRVRSLIIIGQYPCLFFLN